jgi:hypothetical protein
LLFSGRFPEEHNGDADDSRSPASGSEDVPWNPVPSPIPAARDGGMGLTAGLVMTGGFSTEKGRFGRGNHTVPASFFRAHAVGFVSE